MDSGKDKAIEVPSALAAPVAIDETTEVVPIWQGTATLTQGERAQAGNATVFIDLLPRPIIRFEFEIGDDAAATPTAMRLREWFDGSVLEQGQIACEAPLGQIVVDPSNFQGGTLRGAVSDWTVKPDTGFTTAKVLIINGPSHRGKPIKVGRGCLARRLQVPIEGGTVTVDRLFLNDRSKRSVFGFTHVAEIRLNAPSSVDHFEGFLTTLFRTLSLMRGGWVGLVGPWLYADETLLAFSPHVTKTKSGSAGVNWYFDGLDGVFEELFGCLQAAFQDDARAEALQTGLHWLIESHQCAGGIEGAIILQQAALESLAWFEIVHHRKLCTVSGFENLPAVEKIRQLASLYAIATTIPPHYPELVSYAKDHKLNDLPGILVDVRNALVHAAPKKVRRLLDRPSGDLERTVLWYLITGLLEQVVLAMAGYRGPIVRRDVEAEWKVSAVKPAPWA